MFTALFLSVQENLNYSTINQNTEKQLSKEISLSLQVKTGPFAEHSNQLWNISGISSWEKVNSGLIKMYKGEVRKVISNQDSVLLIILP